MGWLSRIFKDGEGESPKKNDDNAESGGGGAGKGYVEAKGTGRFARKKKIETNLGPDGKPVYTGHQLEIAARKMRERKQARAVAREEEKAYVEYRKAEILRSFQPKVGTLRLGDEAFPKRRRVAMGFGERKAHYLAIRPKPKYATWIGRKKGIIEAKPKPKPVQPAAAVVTDHSMLPDHSIHAAPEDDKRTTKDEEEGTDKKEETHDKKEQAEARAGGEGAGGAGGTVKSPDTGTKDDSKKTTEERKKEKKDKGAIPEKPRREVKLITTNLGPDNPIRATDFCPFWCGPLEPDDMTEDDLPVDMDILEKVCSGEKVLSQRPFNKTEFIPHGPIAAMKQDDVLFVRDTILFANTVESVISLQPEDDKKRKPGPPLQYKLKWSNKTRFIMFHPATRLPHKLRDQYFEDFKMVVRDKESVLKQQKGA